MRVIRLLNSRSWQSYVATSVRATFLLSRLLQDFASTRTCERRRVLQDWCCCLVHKHADLLAGQYADMRAHLKVADFGRRLTPSFYAVAS